MSVEMRKFSLRLPLTFLMLSAIFLSCQKLPQSPSDIPIYTFPTKDNQQIDKSSSDPSVESSQLSNNAKDDYVERNIVVDERNNVFSIGIPAGSIEKTEVIAEKPIDIWFEYLPAEAKLEVNGKEVQRDPFHWETKISYTKSVAKFAYQISNITGQYLSYNLRLVPSIAGESVSVIVRQRWTP
ncbi:hypothetical protein ACFLXL_01590 [Chloroflexota bacterium]